MRRTTSDFRAKASRMMLRMANLAGRAVFAATAGGRWLVRGYESAEDIEGEHAPAVEVFQGLHIYARPASSDNAEGVLLNIGAEANHPVIAALRNEDARKRFVAAAGEDLAPGELALFNSAGSSFIRITAAGDIVLEVKSGQRIYARKAGGTAEALATKADVDALSTWASTHTHPDPVSGFTGAPVVSPPSATGTDTLWGD